MPSISAKLRSQHQAGSNDFLAVGEIMTIEGQATIWIMQNDVMDLLWLVH